MDASNLIDAPLEAEEDLSPDSIIEPEKPSTGSSALDIAKQMYGADFNGKYMKKEELIDLIPKFREYYKSERKKDLRVGAFVILRAFMKEIAPLKFYPNKDMYKRWRAEWDRQILSEMGLMEEEVIQRDKVQKIIVSADQQTAFALDPNDPDGSLERGTNNLAGALLNTALEKLKDPEVEDELFDEKTKLKRATFALNVFKEITKKVQGKQALAIKASAEGREKAGFLMNLLQMAQAGKLTAEHMALIRGDNQQEHAETSQ